MANDSGMGKDELAEFKKFFEESDDQVGVRYVEQVQDDRSKRKAHVESRDLVLGNKEAYDPRTVEQQEDLAADRPTEPVSFEEVNLRGAAQAAPAEPKSAQQKQQSK